MFFCVATQEISCAAMQDIPCAATQEFEDLQDLAASQVLILCFSTAAEIAGHLPIKKETAHINPEAPGAPEVTKLERDGIFVPHN